MDVELIVVEIQRPLVLCLASSRNTPRWPMTQQWARRFGTVRQRPIHPVRPAQLLAQWPFSSTCGEA